jgi:hypothetical protein
MRVQRPGANRVASRQIAFDVAPSRDHNPRAKRLTRDRQGQCNERCPRIDVRKLLPGDIVLSTGKNKVSWMDPRSYCRGLQPRSSACRAWDCGGSERSWGCPGLSARRELRSEHQGARAMGSGSTPGEAVPSSSISFFRLEVLYRPTDSSNGYLR